MQEIEIINSIIITITKEITLEDIVEITNKKLHGFKMD